MLSSRVTTPWRRRTPTEGMSTLATCRAKLLKGLSDRHEIGHEIDLEGTLDSWRPA